MFDISGPELLTILLVALIVVGPRRLPELTRRLGSWASEIRSAVRDLRTGLDKDVEALTEPLAEAKEDLTQPFRDVQDDLESTVADVNQEVGDVNQEVGEDDSQEVGDVNQEVEEDDSQEVEEDDSEEPAGAHKGYEWVGPKPLSGPTPEDALADLSEIDEETEEEAS